MFYFGTGVLVVDPLIYLYGSAGRSQNPAFPNEYFVNKHTVQIYFNIYETLFNLINLWALLSYVTVSQKH